MARISRPRAEAAPVKQGRNREFAFRVGRNLPHGYVRAALGTLRRLGLDSLPAGKPCSQRDLVPKVGKALNPHEVTKRFSPITAAGVFGWSRRVESNRREGSPSGAIFQQLTEALRRGPGDSGFSACSQKAESRLAFFPNHFRRVSPAGQWDFAAVTPCRV